MRARIPALQPVIIIPLICLVSILVFFHQRASFAFKFKGVVAEPPITLLGRLEEEAAADARFDFSTRDGSGDPVTVLMWNGGNWAGWGQWDELSTPNYFTNSQPIPKSPCPVRCEFTSDRAAAYSADAVMFEATVPYGIDKWVQDPPQFPEKAPHQTWLMYHYESPEYFPLMAQPAFTRHFDGEVTYRQDAWQQSTFYCPFGGRSLKELLQPPPPKPDRSKLVVFITSNCANGGAARRLAYVEELMRYIPIDSYGICLHNKEAPQPHHMRQQRVMPHGEVMTRRIQLVAEYKFAIAFENTELTPDYVTEKVWTTWTAGTVPIYWGAANIRQWIPGNDSIIEANAFASPKALADYLLAVAADDAAYRRYFEWKKRPLQPVFLALVSNCVIGVDCRVCKKLTRLRAALPASLRPPPRPAAAAQMRFALHLGVGGGSVEIPPAPALDLQAEYSILAWLKLDKFGYGARIVDKSMEGTVSAYTFDVLNHWGQGCLRLCAGGGCHQSEWGAVHLYRWTHVAVTFSLSATKIRFYVDGQLAGFAPAKHPTDASRFPLSFGGPGVRTLDVAGSEASLHGAIDAVSLWSRALTREEIVGLMYRLPRPDEPQLVGFWGLDEGNGTVAHDSGPHGLHGRLRNDARWIPCPTRPVLGLNSSAVGSEAETAPPTSPDTMFAVGLSIGAVFGLAFALCFAVGVSCFLRWRERRNRLRERPL